MSAAPRPVLLVTGSSGHLGDAVCLAAADPAFSLGTRYATVVGVDIAPGPRTTVVASITDRVAMEALFAEHGITHVVHPATLHKPHVATHTKQQFIDTNVSGTLCLLEVAAKFNVTAFVFTSTTSVYSDTVKNRHRQEVKSSSGSPPLVGTWVDERTRPQPKNVYGVTKIAAEGLCALVSKQQRLPVVVLRLSRFFHEPDDDAVTRAAFADANSKLNELLYRRVDVADVVDAIDLALVQAPQLCEMNGWSSAPTFVVSAPSPLLAMPRDVSGTVQEALSTCLAPTEFTAAMAMYEGEGWALPTRLDRVYDSSAAVRVLGWRPKYTFCAMVQLLAERRTQLGKGVDLGFVGSALTASVGRKGYHGVAYGDGAADSLGQPFPVVAD